MQFEILGLIHTSYIQFCSVKSLFSCGQRPCTTSYMDVSLKGGQELMACIAEREVISKHTHLKLSNPQRILAEHAIKNAKPNIRFKEYPGHYSKVDLWSLNSCMQGIHQFPVFQKASGSIQSHDPRSVAHGSLHLH